MTNAVSVTQTQAEDGSFQATITLPGPYTITLEVYPDIQLTNGLPQIVGHVYAPEEHENGEITDESDPIAALDSDIVGDEENS